MRWHGVEGGLGDEPEGALGADEQVGDEVGGAVEVEQRVDAVAHGVLDAEQPVDVGDGLRVGADPFTQHVQPTDERGLLDPQRDVRRRIGGVDDPAAGQHEHHGFDGVVRRLLVAGQHPAGVVRDDPADRARHRRGGVWAEPTPVRGQAGVDRTEGGAGTGTYAQPVVEDLDVAEVFAGVDEHAVGDGLAAEAGAAGTEREGQAGVGGFDHEVRNVLHAGGGDDGGGGEQEVRRVVGHR